MKENARMKQPKDTDLASYYDRQGVLNELIEDDVTLSLEEEFHASFASTSPFFRVSKQVQLSCTALFPNSIID